VSSGVCPVASTTFTVAGGSANYHGNLSILRFLGFLEHRRHCHHEPVEWSQRSFVLGVGAGSQLGCGGLASTSFGYSIDNSATLYPGVNASDIDRSGVSIGAGTHAIHFKS